MKQSTATRRAFCIISLLSGLVTLPLLFSTRAMAQGNLMLMPRRVIFEGSKRYEELNIANIGNDTARYVVSLMHIRMKEDGAFEQIEQPDSGADFADKFLRFFPHSVTLGPKESQVVKIQLTKTNELKPGEYRSHIYFRAVPIRPPLGDVTAPTDSTLSIHLIPIFGISIPVIIRVGPSDTKMDLTDLSLDRGKGPAALPALTITLRRTGNMSSYGDVSVDYIPAQGKTIHAAIVKGVAVYTPNLLRRLRVNLDKLQGIDPHSGKLHVVYSSNTNLKPVKLAEADFVL